MVSSTTFDSIVNAFEDLVCEVIAGTDEKQKAKLMGIILNNYTKLNTSQSTRKPDDQIHTIQAQDKKMPLSVIHNIFPPEMVEKILKFLNYKDVIEAKLTCRRWKDIIENGNLVIKASSKTL